MGDFARQSDERSLGQPFSDHPVVSRCSRAEIWQLRLLSRRIRDALRLALWNSRKVCAEATRFNDGDLDA